MCHVGDPSFALFTIAGHGYVVSFDELHMFLIWLWLWLEWFEMLLRNLLELFLLFFVCIDVELWHDHTLKVVKVLLARIFQVITPHI